MTNPLLRISDPREDMEAARCIWEKAVSQKEAGFFLSWPWISTWLMSLPSQVDVRMISVNDSQERMAAFFFCPKPTRKLRVIPVRRLWLHYTGIPDYDSLTLEYNSIPGCTDTALLWDLFRGIPGKWDDLYLPAMDARLLPEGFSQNPPIGMQVIKERVLPSPYVDLSLVRQRGGDCLPLIHSKKKRYQMRKNLEYFQKKYGSLQVSNAGSFYEALADFEAMADMNVSARKEKGQISSFESQYLRQFHKKLIRALFDTGSIQILKVSAGNRLISIVYNFIHHKNVYVYNSGISQEPDKRIQPGMTSHYLAINHNALRGMKTYDFLAGDDAYKRHLSTHENKMIWLRVRKNRLRFKAEDIFTKMRGSI